MSEAPEPKTLTERDLDPFADPPPPTEPPAGTVGFTHFDTPGSEDDHITVLLPREQLEALVPGAMVRIVSAGDPLTGGADRVFLGAVTGGPYAEPDGLRADAAIAVATTVGGKARWLMPNYHGRAAVQVTAELIDGRPNPPTHRPHPNSAVIPLTDAETADALHVDGPARIGTLLGKPAIHVGIDPADKNQLPRHLGILGTTGGGKSNTVANLVAGLQAQGVSVILLDVEGEYVHLDRPTQQPVMRDLLAARGMEPSGVDGLTVLHPVGRETSREGGGGAHPFCLRFGDLSPYAVMELLELSEAQQHRFMKAFDVLKVVMRDLGMLTRDQIIEIDELDRGIPGMTLAMLRDVVQVCLDKSERDAAAGRGKKGDDDAPPSRLVSSQLRDKEKDIRQRLNQTTVPGNFTSWAALIARINVLVRLNLFDNAKSDPIDPADLTAPGRLTVLDLSDTDSPVVNNLVIASVLRQVQRQQEADFNAAKAAGRSPSPTVIVIEEAHEFLSATRIKEQPHLRAQVERIAKRGRKRWLGLCFVTQLPQHLPDDVLALINSHILHAIRDPQVVARLAKQIPGLDPNQWRRLPALAPGQAVVSLASAARPIIAQIHPSPAALRLTD